MDIRQAITRLPLRQLAHGILEFCYPGACACCQAPCDGAVAVCPACLAKVEALESAPACVRCAGPLAYAGAPCPHCVGKGLYPFDRILRLGAFHEPLRMLIHHLKYHRRWPLGEFLAERLVQREPVSTLLGGAGAIVAVPLHWWRHFTRGYNQSQIIARRLAKLSRVPLVNPVVRIRHTQTQTRLPGDRRHENVRSAFTLTNERAVRGKHVVIVDDVLTSGATLQEVGRTLKTAGPASLSAIVVAAADPKGYEPPGVA